MAEVVPLAAAERPDAGGKAAGLARLMRLGLRVPAGFVLIGPDVVELPLEGHLEHGVRYAVRSSAMDEDGSEHSFAGQFHTSLDCLGPDEVRAGVQACVASAEATRVQRYTAARPGADTSIAVVVQRMVEPAQAGVLFTADPVSGRRDRWILEVVDGLGEDLVSGAVQGRRTVYDRWGRRLEGDGFAQEEALLDGARRLAHELGRPVDIEFAVDRSGAVWFLQGRPVTALPAVHPNELDDIDGRPGAVYTTANVSEMMPGPVTPLTCSVFGYAVDQGMQDYMVRIGAQPARVDAPQYIYPSYQHLFIRLDALYRTVHASVGATKRDVDLAVVGRPVPESTVGTCQPWWRRVLNLRRLARYLWQVPSRVRALETMAAAFRVHDDGTIEGLYRALDQAQAPLVRAYGHHYAASVSSGTWLGALTGIVTGRGETPTAEDLSTIADLLSDIEGVESADAVTALQSLGAQLRARPDSARFSTLSLQEAVRWLQDTVPASVAAFLDRHGHRCVREAELRTRAWRDDPGAWVPLLQAVAGSLDPTRAPSRKRTMPQGLGMRFVLPRARRGVVVREACKSHLIRVQDQLKQGYRRLGRRLAEAGLLPDPDLVYFYTHRELARVVAGSADPGHARSRRDQLARLWTLSFPVISVGPPAPTEDDPVPEGDLTGIPVSRGVVEGRVVVAHRLEDAQRLQPGDILVARTTDVGWSPWFAVAGGIVTEIGSPLSHGAVVAREYGIPAVVGAAGATTLAEGTRIRLDGSQGTVQVLPDVQ